MSSLGVDDRVQPDDRLPELARGVHLRWGFTPDRGFARHGYYLFRRPHVDEKEFPTTETGFRFRPSNDVRQLPEPAFRVDITVSTQNGRGVETTALSGDVAVAEARIPNGGSVTFRGDAITGLRFNATGTARIVVYPVEEGLDDGWKRVPDAPAPICLPLSHPDYECHSDPEDVDAGRRLAKARIQYGEPSRYVEARPLTDAGSVTVHKGLPVVVGTDTDWGGDAVGSFFRVAGDDTGYLVVRVLAENRLVLSRPYEGRSGTNRNYELADDPYGQLHDTLVHLVADGPSAGGMAGRTLPLAVHDAGTMKRQKKQTAVHGTGTNWTDDLIGLSLRVVQTDIGTVDLTQGERTVSGSATNWTDSIVGAQFRINDQRATYTVASVAGMSLELDRPYAGPTTTGANYAIFEQTSDEIADVVSGSELELATPFPGPDDSTAREYVIECPLEADVGSSAQAQTGSTPSAPTASLQYPLETVLLGALDPALAQVLGLYWIDASAEIGASYDYLVVADYDGRVGQIVAETETFHPITSELLGSGTGFPADGYILFDRRIDQRMPLHAHEELDAYALPGTVPDVRGGNVHGHESSGASIGPNNAGLIWEQERSPSGKLLPDQPVLYHLWRHQYPEDVADPSNEDDGPADRPERADYELVGGEDGRGEPILVGDPIDLDTEDVVRPNHWPPFPMKAIDGGLADGWYSYRLTGVDVFGRHSAFSPVATWRDWDPEDTLHDFAVRLQDTSPPPAPTGVEAELLDPADPYVTADQPYDDWRAANPDVLGLRVRWQWPERFREQAPDASEFHLQLRAGRQNGLDGTITDTDERLVGHTVSTDIPHDANDDPNDFAGTTLHVDGDAYPVTGATHDFGTGTLELDIRHLGHTGDDKSWPPIGGRFVLAIPPVYANGTIAISSSEPTVVRGTNVSWTDSLVGETFRTADDVEGYEVLVVRSYDELVLNREYEPPSGVFPSGVEYAVGHPLWIDFTDTEEWPENTGWAGTHGTIAVPDISAREMIDGESVWEYDAIVPVSSGVEADLAVSAFDPKAYATVGVSTMDDDENEGPVSASARVARIRRTPPNPPEIPPLDSVVEVGTPPDYDGRARYTVRWVDPGPDLGTFVFRALDETLFRADWDRRKSGASPLEASQQDRFPPDLRDEDGDAQSVREQKRVSRETVAGLLNQFDGYTTFEEALDHYRDLAEVDDPNDPQDALGPAALRVLAGFPGNTNAFTQRTADPLFGPHRENVAGPDFEDGDPGPNFVPGSDDPPSARPGTELAAFVDVFDGRARNCHLYRLANVDRAYNRSDSEEVGSGDDSTAGMSYPLAPVRSRDTTPPRTPRITKAFAGHHDANESGDRCVTLRWVANRERDFEAYRVYRTDDPDAARDVRLMDDRGSVAPSGVTECVWTDADVPPFRTQYYRVVAIDRDGNVSEPSASAAVRAYDDARPDPPTWNPTTVDAQTGEATLSWRLAAPDHRSLVQRRAVGETDWTNLTGWLDVGGDSASDARRTIGEQYDYRVLVVADDGRQNDQYNVETA